MLQQQAHRERLTQLSAEQDKRIDDQHSDDARLEAKTTDQPHSNEFVMEKSKFNFNQNRDIEVQSKQPKPKSSYATKQENNFIFDLIFNEPGDNHQATNELKSNGGEFLLTSRSVGHVIFY
jgi:hypothetical protein